MSVQLDHASIVTAEIERAAAFYSSFLGLVWKGVEQDPLRPERRRAMLTDSDGREVLEIIEMPEMAHMAVPGRGGMHHLGFRMNRQDWHGLRARLDAAPHPYSEIEGTLFTRDLDGLVLEIHCGA